MSYDEQRISDQIDGGLFREREIIKEMEELADKICREQLGQEPNEGNLSFRKAMVHGMFCWNKKTQELRK